MKQITATIVYPVDIKISVPEKSNSDFIWQALMKAADKEINDSSIAPVIHTCSETSLISHGIKKSETDPDTQSEWVQKAIEGLVNAKKNISAAVIARPFLLKLNGRDKQPLVDKIDKLAALAKEIVGDIIAATSPIESVKRHR